MSSWLAINDVSVAEGNTGTKTMTFTVTRTGAMDGTSTVAYATANGTAAGSDYQAASGTLRPVGVRHSGGGQRIPRHRPGTHRPQPTPA